MTSVDTTTEFIMDVLKGDSTLVSMVNNKIMSEIPRTDVSLDKTYKTIVGMTLQTNSQQSYFMSTIRGYVRSEIVLQIVVISGYESNDKYCRSVVKRIRDILQDSSYVGNTYRIFVNSIHDEVKSDSSVGKWTGTMTINLVRFDINI